MSIVDRRRRRGLREPSGTSSSRTRLGEARMTLVRGVDEDPLRQALVAASPSSASAAARRSIAEGVEREAEAEALLDIGVEFAQGFLTGRPERGRS